MQKNQSMNQLFDEKILKNGWAKQGLGLSILGGAELVKESSHKCKYTSGIVRGLTWVEKGRNGKRGTGPGCPNP